MRVVNAIGTVAVVLVSFLGALGPVGFARAVPEWLRSEP